MSAITIQAKSRGTGKKSTKAVRNSGMIPGVFYGKGKEPIAIATTHKQLRPVVYTSDTHIIHLDVEGTGAMDCVIRDVTFDPVTEEIVHFDLQGIIEGQLIHVEAPIILVGHAKGVSIGGGILEHMAHKVTIECLPNALPEHIEVDVTNLEVGSSVHIRDLKVPGVKFLTAPDVVIVAVHSKKVRGEEATTPETKA